MGYCQGGLGFRVYGFRVSGLLSGFPLRVTVRFGLRMLACRVAGTDIAGPGPGFRAEGLGFRLSRV